MPFSTGYYYYINSAGFVHGTRFRLMSEPLTGVLNNNNKLVLSFYYHMYGKHVGTLVLYAKLTSGILQLVKHIEGGVKTGRISFKKNIIIMM